MLLSRQIGFSRSKTFGSPASRELCVVVVVVDDDDDVIVVVCAAGGGKDKGTDIQTDKQTDNCV